MKETSRTMSALRYVVVAFRVDRETAAMIRAAARRDDRRPSAYLARLVARALHEQERAS
jgi:hypothetical protein